MTDLATLHAALDRAMPVYGFPWHDKQLAALAASPDVLCIPAGNRGGKTEVAAGIVGLLVRREGPIYARLHKPEGRPLKIWVAPQTLEKYTSNWDARLEERVFKGIKHGSKTSPWVIWEWEDEHGGGTLWGKSQDQGWRSFESDDVDLVVFDEEPEDPKLVSSAVTRTGTTNGVVVMAYTPLLGLTWAYWGYVEPTMKPDNLVSDRHWRTPGGEVEVIQFGMADNPAVVAGGGVERARNDPTMSEAERQARLYGEYGFAEGLIFPQLVGIRSQSQSIYLLDKLPEDRPYSWTLTIDPNKRHGGLLVGIDHDGNRYCVAEHFREGWPDTQHGLAYKEIVKVTGLDSLQVPTFADPGGAGAQAILNMAEVGIFATPVPKGPGSVKASIEAIRRSLWVDPNHLHPVTGLKGAPRLYFLKTLRSEWTVPEAQSVPFAESRLLWELRQYRQDSGAVGTKGVGKPPDTPIKKFDDVTDCLRYHFLVRPVNPDAEAWAATVAEEKADAMRKELDRTSQRASDEFDDLARQAMRPRGQSWDLT